MDYLPGQAIPVFEPSIPLAERIFILQGHQDLAAGRQPFPYGIHFRVVPRLIWKDTDGLNLNDGPALIAINGCPARSKDTRSQSPEGVSVSLVTLMIFEPGKSET